MNKKKGLKALSPYLLVLLSFLLIILIGSFLLTLPAARTDGKWGSYIDALFSATSATCVTGLCTYANGIGNELTFFGQLTMAIMIQIGGLGLITILTFLITLFSKLQFKNRYFLSQAVNSDSVADVSKFVRKVIAIALCGQIIGFLLFLPAFFTLKGKVLVGTNYIASDGELVWHSFFTSVSMFNNAGFDLFGGTSLIRGVGNPYMDTLSTGIYNYICIVTMLLIIFGGISFLVVIEVFSFKKKPSQWSAFTKIVLCTTGILLVLGAASIMLTDGLKKDNPINVLQAIFQSVTCRTAGAATYDQASLSSAGKIVSCLLMFIGGSPLSTAGGIKTTTIFIIVLAVFCFLRGKKVTAFKRIYSQQSIVKAMSLVLIALGALLLSFVIILKIETNNTRATSENVVFEIFSAFGTVGLSASLTPTLQIGSKIILIMLMFLGRLGPMTFFQIFQKNLDNQEDINFQYLEEDFLIG